MLFCRVLGPIRIEIDGDEVELGGAVPRRLLSALTVYGGAPVSNSILAELVWGEDAPVDNVSTIRVVVHRLRAALGADRGCLESTGSGYRLAPQRSGERSVNRRPGQRHSSDAAPCPASCSPLSTE